ncbi:hypothetical protein MMC27_005785 [Xylographa pallens]|nr:hypothetical protein [Xylographa pallens]
MEAIEDNPKYPVSLTDDQWLILQEGKDSDGEARFPHLERDKCRLLEKLLKGNYSCIGWSVNPEDPEKLTINPETLIGFEDFCTSDYLSLRDGIMILIHPTRDHRS